MKLTRIIEGIFRIGVKAYKRKRDLLIIRQRMADAGYPVDQFSDDQIEAAANMIADVKTSEHLSDQERDAALVLIGKAAPPQALKVSGK
jgi:hypothetical protein